MEIYKQFFDLTDQIVLITGASKGLGKGMAEAFAAAGAKVFLISRNEKQLQENVSAILSRGSRASFFAGDVNNIDFVHQVVNEIREKETRIDVLINNAGVVFPKKAFDISVEDWDSTIETNLKSVFFFSQTAAQVMKERSAGRIINISSIMGAVGDISLSTYCASKGG